MYKEICFTVNTVNESINKSMRKLFCHSWLQLRLSFHSCSVTFYLLFYLKLLSTVLPAYLAWPSPSGSFLASLHHSIIVYSFKPITARWNVPLKCHINIDSTCTSYFCINVATDWVYSVKLQHTSCKNKC